MALSFREETELIREGADFLVDGHTRAELEEMLYTRDLYKADVDRLGFQIDKELSVRYGEGILEQLERNASAGNDTSLNDAVFADLAHRQTVEFARRRESRVRLLLREQQSPEEIRRAVVHPLFSADEVDHTIRKELSRQENNEGRDEPGGTGSMVLGGALIALGIGLGYAFPGTLFYGLMLVGVYYIVRGFTN